jgi:hypothetical protein
MVCYPFVEIFTGICAIAFLFGYIIGGWISQLVDCLCLSKKATYTPVLAAFNPKYCKGEVATSASEDSNVELLDFVLGPVVRMRSTDV